MLPMIPTCPVCQSIMIKVGYIINNTNYFECNSNKVEPHRAIIDFNDDWILTLYKPDNQTISRNIKIQFQPPNRYTICFFNLSNAFVIPPCTFPESYAKLKHYLTLKTFL
jgi:hypothetical protein